jgi:large subunit ribosomal protein L32e
MADEPTAPAEPEPAKPPAKRRRAPAKPAAAPAAAPAKKEKAEELRAPRRATLSADRRRLLALRGELDARRPIFGRQAANRYWRIGRDGTWRRPRGLQSKQRRHYGYRAQVVSIGYRSPAAVRGLAPNGFRPVVVRTDAELERIDVHSEAAVIARTVGTRRRLTLEETARRRGIHLLNPIVKSEREE